MQWVWDWAKYHNSHSSKTIWATKLSFGQNDLHRSTPFWKKNILVTPIIFEPWLLCTVSNSSHHPLLSQVILILGILRWHKNLPWCVAGFYWRYLRLSRFHCWSGLQRLEAAYWPPKRRSSRTAAGGWPRPPLRGERLCKTAQRPATRGERVVASPPKWAL